MTESPPARLPARRSTRLHGFDYSSNAAYVITICAHDRKHLFGAIVDGNFVPSAIGKIVEREWRKTAELRPGVLLDAFILMPNHLHGIIILNLPDEARAGARPESVGAILRSPGEFRAPSVGIGAIVRGFKSAVTSQVASQFPQIGRQIWQRGYFDHIIRNENELDQCRRYIANNPQQWELDRYFGGGAEY